VALSGDGGDELLAGYPTYLANVLWSRYRHLPLAMQKTLKTLADHLVRPSYSKVSFDYKLRQFLGASGRDPYQAHFWWRVIFSDAEINQLLHPDLVTAIGDYHPYQVFNSIFHEVSEASFLDQTLYVDIRTWLLDDILVKADRMSMASSVEVRSPFLDHQVVEFAARLPTTFKMVGRQQKIILRQAFAKKLPPDILRRAKRGFNAPTSSVGRLCVPATVGDGIINPSYLLDERREDVTYKSFLLAVLTEWLKMFSVYKKHNLWQESS
jgi:asparagine synthase (glutamine-hydrolysing)